MLHLPVGTFSRTAVEVLAVGLGIAALRVVEYWSWKGELEGGVPSTRDETLTSSDGNYAAVRITRIPRTLASSLSL